MHPAYHPIHRRARLVWVLRALAGYALAELAAEAWQTVRPRPKLVERVRRAGW